MMNYVSKDKGINKSECALFLDRKTAEVPGDRERFKSSGNVL